MTLEANSRKESVVKDVAIAVIILMGAIATTVFLPFSFLFTAFVVVLILSLLGAKWGANKSFIALIPSFLVSWWGGGVFLFLIFLPFFCEGILFGVFLKKGQAPFAAVAKGIAFLGIVFVLVLWIAAFLRGTPLFDLSWWQNNLDTTYESLKEAYLQSGVLEILAAQGINEEEFFGNLKHIVSHIYLLIPITTLISLGLIALASYLLATFILKRKGRETASFPLFRTWHLPWPWIWLLIAALSFWLVGHHWQLGWAMAIGENLFLGYAFLSFIIGLSIISYFYAKWAPFFPPFLRFLLIFLVMIQLPLFMILCVLLGAFDPLLDLRKLQKAGQS